MISTADEVALLFPELATREELDALFRSLSDGDVEEVLGRPEGVAVPLDASVPGCSAPPADEATLPFGEWLFSVVAVPVAAFDARLASLTILADPTGARLELLSTLHGLLFNEAIRTLVAELHAARDRGELTGRTPEERYDAFLARLRELHVRADLAARHGRLIHRLVGKATRVLGYVIEVLDATTQESAALTELFPEIGAALRVNRVVVGRGDSHRGGRTVAMLELAGGHTLVFKPRDLHIDLAFQRLLRAVNDELGIGLRTLRVHATPSGGWSEFVQRGELGTADAEAYYRDIGRLTAVLHLIDGRDVHFENVVCDGRNPVIVDLETLLHPRPLRGVEHGDGSATQRATDLLAASVCAIGILPSVVAHEELTGEPALNVGAVGYVPGAVAPFRSFALRNRCRDDLHIEFSFQNVDAEAGVPALAREPGVAESASAQVQAGFVEIYDWALRRRSTLRQLVAEQFEDVTIRYIHNPTYFYVQLLRMATHPSFQGVGPEARIVLHRVGLRRPDSDPRLTRAELTDLLDGDVPYFVASASSRSVTTSTGVEIEDCLEVSPMDGVLAKIDAAGPEDRDRQLTLVAMSFMSKYDPSGDLTGTRLAEPGSTTRVRPGDALQAATEIGEHLARTMVRSTDPRFPSTWVGPLVTTSDAQFWQPGNLGYDMYGGITGIALYLAQLAQLTGRRDFADAARSVVEPLAVQLDLDVWRETGFPCGGFGGLGGVAYVTARVGTALDDPHLIAAGVRGIGAVGSLVDADNQLELMSGSTGAIAVALRLHALATDDEGRRLCLETARAAHAHLRSRHAAWTGEGELYAGFAHGVAAMHSYLRILSLTGGDEEAAADADRLLALERGLRDPESGRWFVSSRRDRTASGWCNGSAGLLLARLLSLRAGHPADAVTLRETEVLLDDVVRNGFGNDITMCHGDLGSLEVLRLAAEVLDDPALAARVHSTAAQLHDRQLATFRSVPRSRFALVDSIFLGAAGAGHALLRSCAPEDVPAFLWFD